jgi:hypothetical protein
VVWPSPVPRGSPQPLPSLRLERGSRQILHIGNGGRVAEPQRIKVLYASAARLLFFFRIHNKNPKQLSKS